MISMAVHCNLLRLQGFYMTPTEFSCVKGSDCNCRLKILLFDRSFEH